MKKARNSVTDAIICAEESYFDDDRIAFCVDCSAKLWVRPYAMRIPIKWCDRCGKRYLQNHPQPVLTMPETVRELEKMRREGRLV